MFYCPTLPTATCARVFDLGKSNDERAPLAHGGPQGLQACSQGTHVSPWQSAQRRDRPARGRQSRADRITSGLGNGCAKSIAAPTPSQKADHSTCIGPHSCHLASSNFANARAWDTGSQSSDPTIAEDMSEHDELSAAKDPQGTGCPMGRRNPSAADGYNLRVLDLMTFNPIDRLSFRSGAERAQGIILPAQTRGPTD
jgi:hypothetical protein